jgi:hypothetical protein
MIKSPATVICDAGPVIHLDEINGTIGILIRSIRRGQRNPKEVLLILSEIPLKSTLHIKPSLLNEISMMIRKEFHL